MQQATVKPPTAEQLLEVAAELGFSIGEDQLASYLGLVEATLQPYKQLSKIADYHPTKVKYARTPGYQPQGEENRWNAWFFKTEVAGAAEGKLKGKTIALKDNICLAGVPMQNGSFLLEGYVPDVDATVVTRVLDAGATILGKAHCEDLCLSGGSHTNCFAPVTNPFPLQQKAKDKEKEGEAEEAQLYSAGGSSSGCAALVAAGEVDMAIGGDQGGSIRIPSSFCGTCGMKPTHGLVPYTGIVPIEATIDHCGPITANVRDNALLLEVLAGVDGLDARQNLVPPTSISYTEALGQDIKGLKIGFLKEGFELQGIDPKVSQLVKETAEQVFRKLGAEVLLVSLPMHPMGLAIWSPIALEGAVDQMYPSLYGTGRRGFHVTGLAHAMHAGHALRSNALADTAKILLMAGTYAKKHYHNHYYFKAQNLSLKLRQEYDALLQQVDLLLMPTLPTVATPLPKPDASREEYIALSFQHIGNTASFDVTGHPAMSIPCGTLNGLPVGMMLVGKHFDESTIYKGAYAFEQAIDWTSHQLTEK
ncbi:Asp-tRNA(Asn)/Glu-tRNA(Gln) amidotransferase GatCAB subunit A [Balamuthia mandrillaris]